MRATPRGTLAALVIIVRELEWISVLLMGVEGMHTTTGLGRGMGSIPAVPEACPGGTHLESRTIVSGFNVRSMQKVSTELLLVVTEEKSATATRCTVGSDSNLWAKHGKSFAR